MSFIHDDPEFPELLRVVVGRQADQGRGIGEALIEKDYWVTHTLWSLQDAGLEVYFKGGTSLSKAFGLIERFSEDIDAWVKRGGVEALPEVTSWKSTNKGPVAKRRRFYEGLPGAIQVPGATIELDQETFPPKAQSALYLVRYPGHFLAGLEPANRPYVQLEVGHAEVIPNVPATLSSFVHDHLEAAGQLEEFTDNRPKDLPTVHPLATLIEKLEAIQNRYDRGEGFDPAAFVRHYEDAARIIQRAAELPALEKTAGELAEEMLARRQVRNLPGPEDPALTLEDEAKRAAVQKAYEDIRHMFWGPRLTLEEACGIISTWLKSQQIGPQNLA